MKRVLCSIVLVVGLMQSRVAAAEPDEGAKLVARELMAKGRAQRESGDREGALESFSKAHAIMHVPTTLLETARACVETGRMLEALQLVSEPAAPAADEPEPFTRARSEADQLRRELEQRVPRVRIDLSGAPTGPAPTMTIDGAPRPDCVAGCRLNPGRHLVAARTAHALAEEQLQLREGDQQQLELVFSPLELPATPPRPGAADAAEAAGPPQRRVPTATWVAGGVAFVSLTMGTVLGLRALHERDRLESRCAPACSTDEVDGVRREVVMSNVAFGVGLSAAALAVVSYVLARPASTPVHAQRGWDIAAAPSPDGRGGFVAWGGRL
jgi:hypothetical protein